MTAPPGAPAQAEAAEFLIEFTRIGHDAGYSTAELEERVLALAAGLRLEGAQVSATPTLVDVSIGALADQRSYSIRVRPSAVDLDAIARLDEIVERVLDASLDAGGALPRLREVETRPLSRPWFVSLAAYALAGAALAPVLGGGWRDVLGSGIVGLAVGGLPLSRRGPPEPSR